MRLLDWESRLRAWAHFRHGDPFQWGVTDCWIVCLEAVDCMRGGASLAAGLRGRYGTRRGALKLQRREDLDLGRVLESAGARRVLAPPLAGDIVIHQHPDDPFGIGHVCFGEVVLSAHQVHGVALGRTADALAMVGAGVWRAA